MRPFNLNKITVFGLLPPFAASLGCTESEGPIDAVDAYDEDDHDPKARAQATRNRAHDQKMETDAH